MPIQAVHEGSQEHEGDHGEDDGERAAHVLAGAIGQVAVAAQNARDAGIARVVAVADEGREFGVVVTLQPAIGIYTDKRPLPYSIAGGMAFTAVGLVVLGFAHDYWLLLIGSALAPST